ncbi:MAG: thiamine-phosphate kinase [Phycisphaerales bacterium]|nr:thiamine-phosphate kinase [Phycisphaerales bacterium]
MNEHAVLDRICATGSFGPEVRIGPGDDMALLDLASESSGTGVLVAVDQIIDGIHVCVDGTPLSIIGRKAVARALSDVAAMAGRPVASLVSAVVPMGWSDESAIELFEGMRDAATQYRSPIIGGDLAVHQDAASPLTCSVTVLARPTEHGPVSRFGAQVGDRICVTGRLGGSLDEDGAGHHLTFEPRIGEAIMLHAILGEQLHAMIDLSDGLGTDAAHMVERDPCMQMHIDASLIPCSEGSSWRQAVHDGEDYELCFCTSGLVPEQILECPVTEIGRVVECSADDARRVVVVDGSDEHDVTNAGWEHVTK